VLGNCESVLFSQQLYVIVAAQFIFKIICDIFFKYLSNQIDSEKSKHNKFYLIVHDYFLSGAG